MLRTKEQADLIVLDLQGRPVAAVEVKNVPNLDDEAAVRLRRNFVAHRALSEAPYFLLVSEDYGYLWTHAPPSLIAATPSFVIPMRQIAERYGASSTSHSRLQEAELEALVFQWLLDLAHRDASQDDEATRILRQAGFVEAIRGGRVLYQDVG